jgi:hypothetical protein
MERAWAEAVLEAHFWQARRWSLSNCHATLS